jgi:hypothetical protein
MVGQRKKSSIQALCSKSRRRNAECEFTCSESSGVPADLVSRGMGLEKLITSEIWRSGPKFLQNTPDEWPRNKVETDISPVIAELKKTERMHVTMDENTERQEINGTETFYWRLDPSRYSNWKQLCRRQAWVRRFITNSRLSKAERQPDELNPEELQGAENQIISKAQQESFP